MHGTGDGDVADVDKACSLAVWAVVHSSSRPVRAWCVHIVLYGPSNVPITAFRDTFLCTFSLGPRHIMYTDLDWRGKNVVCAVTTSLIMTALPTAGLLHLFANLLCVSWWDHAI
jgi:hypothetical protein